MERTDVVCFCKKVTYGDVLDSIKSGSKTLDDIKATTSAGITCGACKARLMKILKENS